MNKLSRLLFKFGKEQCCKCRNQRQLAEGEFCWVDKKKSAKIFLGLLDALNRRWLNENAVGELDRHTSKIMLAPINNITIIVWLY
jgi:hypothetical protein